MKTSSILILMISLTVFFCNNTQGQENKFTKTYDLNYSIEQKTAFKLSNKSYFVEYKKVNDDVNKFQQSNFQMELKYYILNSDNEGLEFMVEYIDRQRENYYKNQIQTTDWVNLKGGKIKYNLSKKGLVSDFKDFNKLNTKLSDENIESTDQLKEEIIHLFPALPDNQVTIGDKWYTSFGGEEGFESFTVEYILLDELIFNGTECVKIIANYTTEESYEVTMGGKKYQVVSESTGHDIYYFAYKKGILLSRYSIGNGTTDIYDLNKVLKQQRLSNVLYETNIVF